MSCNSANHPPDCQCGFGQQGNPSNLIDHSGIEGKGTAQQRKSNTYLTSCWDCGVQVYFYKHDNGGCALFDELGHPWGLHECWERHRNNLTPIRLVSLFENAIKDKNARIVNSVYKDKKLWKRFFGFNILRGDLWDKRVYRLNGYKSEKPEYHCFSLIIPNYLRELDESTWYIKETDDKEIKLLSGLIVFKGSVSVIEAPVIGIDMCVNGKRYHDADYFEKKIQSKKAELLDIYNRQCIGHSEHAEQFLKWLLLFE